jgi:RND superfamily putative drug exporter
MVFAFVLTLSFILLLLAFRSIVVPLKAILFNLLSVGAAWGIMVAVFSFGIGRDLLGYNESPIIEMWLPILMFCVLFGLSMDYHVFIVSRIREHYDISHNNHESVAVGLRSTGKIITGAAAIMVVVFGAFSMGSMLSIQQLGFGLAVAIALDATIIRSVLVPSVMTLAGDWNWYLPKWLDWLPDLRIEGDRDHLA